MPHNTSKIMILLTKICFFIIAIALGSVVDATSGKSTVVYVHVLFRHGNRTPDHSSVYPKDPHRSLTYQPFGFGQLTTKGKRTEYNIGLYLRETYGHLIPQQYTEDVAYAITTNTKRSKMSLELVLAALFPPLQADTFYEGLNWQPASFLVEENEDLLSIAIMTCANFIQQFYTYMLSKEGQQIINSYRDIYEKLSTLTGLEITTPGHVGNIFSILTSQQDLGLRLPEWAKHYFPDIIEDISSWYFEFATITPRLRRLMSGRLIKKIVDDSHAVRNGTSSHRTKISLYSAHDLHVAALLRSFNVHKRHMPPYGATVFIEVHDIKGSYFVKLYYQDYTKSSPNLLTIPGCGTICELDKFTELVSDNFPGPADICTFTGELF